ncbi:MAG: hypothetical protein CR972_00305, partial [Candidatus Moraniibacteriota bacterium]
ARFTVIATLEVSESFDFDGAFWQWVKKQCNIDRVFRFDDYLSDLFVQKFLKNGAIFYWLNTDCTTGIDNLSNTFRLPGNSSETGITSFFFSLKSITFSK